MLSQRTRSNLARKLQPGLFWHQRFLGGSCQPAARRPDGHRRKWRTGIEPFEPVIAGKLVAAKYRVVEQPQRELEPDRPTVAQARGTPSDERADCCHLRAGD